MRFVLALVFLSAAAHADERSLLYGRWGQEAQCRGNLILETGTKRAAPFEIRPEWLKHSDLWCMLMWFPAQPREDGLFVSTRARCGEDSVRSYRLDMVLEDETLTLIWDEALVNGPLMRCTAPS